jgi:putative CocE/NonD family hydrolase
LIQRALRRLMGLPEQRCDSAEELEWVEMRDGVRLATYHRWPLDVQDAPTVLMRTPYGVHGGMGPMGALARLIAESGYHCVSQDVRGRYASEGKFEPFVSEQADGADTLDWLVAQPWSNGRIGLFGPSYLAYTAWAALAARPQHVSSMALSIGSRDLYSTFYKGGAFSFANALEWATGVGERENVPPRSVDLERGFAYRPVRGADRVARRKVDAYRDWVDHPRDDAYWQAIRPTLPESVPPTLLLAGFWDFFLDPQLADWRAIVASDPDAHRLTIGPWAHGLVARWRWWRHDAMSASLRESIAHFDVHLREQPETRTPRRVRYFVTGADSWRDADSWPPEEAVQHVLHLRNEHGAGRLDFDAPDSDPPLGFRSDPRNPVATFGGALFGLKSGAKNQSKATPHSDVLTYTSAPLESALLVLGKVRVELCISVDAEDADFTAKLMDVDPKGRAFNLCDGVVRARWRNTSPSETEPNFLVPGESTEITIELGDVALRFGAGHVIRLDIAGSNAPRFDMNPGDRRVPAEADVEEARSIRQTVLHASERPTRLILGGA